MLPVKLPANSRLLAWGGEKWPENCTGVGTVTPTAELALNGVFCMVVTEGHRGGGFQRSSWEQPASPPLLWLEPGHT